MKKKKIFLTLIIVGLIIISSTMIIYAATPDKSIYISWNLIKSSLWKSTYRNVGWSIIMFLRNIANLCEKLFVSSINFMTFGISNIVTQFVNNNINPFIGVLLGIGILFFGISIILMKSSSRNKIVVNFMLFIISVFGLPILMNELTVISQSATKMFLSESASASTSVVKDNIIDFKYIDSKKFLNIDKTNNLTDNAVIALNIDELISPNDSSLQRKDVFENELVVNAKGELEVKKADFGGWFGIGASHYYRYNFDFIGIIFTLLATIIVFFFMSYKAIRLSWELAYTRVFAILVSPVDITEGAKIKKILVEILTMYVSFVFIGISFRLFTMGTSYISHNFDNLLLRSIFILFLSLIVIDGPNIVERILGMDIGLKSSMATVFSLYHGSKAFTNAASSIFSSGSNMMQNIGKAVNNADLGNRNIFTQKPSHTAEGNNNVVTNNEQMSSGTPFSNVVGSMENGMPKFNSVASITPPSSSEDSSSSPAYDNTINSENSSNEASSSNIENSSNNSSVATNNADNTTNIGAAGANNNIENNQPVSEASSLHNENNNANNIETSSQETGTNNISATDNINADNSHSNIESAGNIHEQGNTIESKGLNDDSKSLDSNIGNLSDIPSSPFDSTINSQQAPYDYENNGNDLTSSSPFNSDVDMPNSSAEYINESIPNNNDFGYTEQQQSVSSSNSTYNENYGINQENISQNDTVNDNLGRNISVNNENNIATNLTNDNKIGVQNNNLNKNSQTNKKSETNRTTIPKKKK